MIGRHRKRYTAPAPPPVRDGRKRIRGGMGLGDNLYVQSVARYLVERGAKLEVSTNWPDVFRPLAGKVTIAPYHRDKAGPTCIVAHYPGRKNVAGTTQWQDVCISAGITEPVEQRLDWVPTGTRLIDQVRASGKPVVCVQLPRKPMGRADNFGAELLPDCSAIQHAIDALRGRAFVVQIGADAPVHRFSGIDLDLANKTTVCELLDVASVADAFLGYVSFLVPLAESFRKPALFVWSRRGLASQHEFIRTVTPVKLLHLPSSRAVMDDAPQSEIQEAALALLGA